MGKKEFTSTEISKALGIEWGRLREWIVKGFIVPSVKGQEGPGRAILFSLDDVYGIYLFRQMVEYGWNRGFASVHVKKMINRADFARYPYVALGRTSRPNKGSFLASWESPGKAWAALHDNYDDMIIINLENLRSQVNKALG